MPSPRKDIRLDPRFVNARVSYDGPVGRSSLPHAWSAVGEPQERPGGNALVSPVKGERRRAGLPRRAAARAPSKPRADAADTWPAGRSATPGSVRAALPVP